MLHADKVVQGPAPDIILARNLEMLPLALRVRKQVNPARPPRLIYEVLDIHRLLVGPGLVPGLMRAAERRLCRGVDRVLLSSMRFDEEHFHRYGQITTPPLLVENKVWDPTVQNEAQTMAQTAAPPPRPPRSAGDPITIGWFGILRCNASLLCLDALCRQANGRIRLVLRGRPARDALPDFDRIVGANPHIAFHGAYSYPADLAEIYGGVDLAWLVDRFDAGANSDWLLPNRLYESCAHGTVPLALAGTETGRTLARRGLGLVLPDLQPATVATLMAGLDDARLAALRGAIAKTAMTDWRTSRQECIRLVAQLAGQADAPRTAPQRPRPDQVEIAG
jgi:succinoglycan biosynthesis protein ExoL